VIEQLGGVLGLLGNTVISEPIGHIAKGAERISASGTTTDPAIEAMINGRISALIASVKSARG
jgi:hypothetical protein